MAGFVGAFSGGVSKLAVYPMDTVKKRLQGQSFGTLAGNPGRYKGAIDCGLRIVREEVRNRMFTSLKNKPFALPHLHHILHTKGPKTLYRGLAPTLIKSMAGPQWDDASSPLGIPNPGPSPGVEIDRPTMGFPYESPQTQDPWDAERRRVHCRSSTTPRGTTPTIG